MKPNKIFKTGAAFALAAAMMLTSPLGMTGGNLLVKVSAADNVYKAIVPKAVLGDVLKPYNVNPGDTVDVVIPVKASNYSIRNPIVNVDLSNTPGFTLASEVTCTDENGNPVGNITVRDKVYVKFSIKIPLKVS